MQIARLLVGARTASPAAEPPLKAQLALSRDCFAQSRPLCRQSNLAEDWRAGSRSAKRPAEWRRQLAGPPAQRDEQPGSRSGGRAR